MFDFLLLPLLAGLGVVLAAAPLGCVVVWRRMAYFGDATAHAAILGVAGALAFELPIFGGAFLIALVMVLALVTLRARGYAADAILGVLSHGALALGLTAVALMNGVRVDLLGLLFGDILAVSASETALIWAGAVLVVALLAWRWSRLLTATVDPGIAMAAGVDPKREELIFTLALAAAVAVGLKAVGALLIGGLLIIPAAAARPIARTPEMMVIGAAIIGLLSLLGGFAVSVALDTPTGPSIVSAALGFFALTNLAAVAGIRQS